MSTEEFKGSLARILSLAIPGVLMALFLRGFVFGLFVVPSSSMVPTLLIGDYVISNEYVVGYNTHSGFGALLKRLGIVGGIMPYRGDIIVIKSAVDSDHLLVKRLIGLPGDTIQMIGSELYINREKIARDALGTPVSFPGDNEPGGDIVDYIEYLPPHNRVHLIRLLRGLEDETTVNNTAEITVPPHNYFFMGDNRDNSSDSRTSELGFVPEENLVGRASTIFFSMLPNADFWDFSSWSWAVRWYRLWRPVL
jgi:signal peptidase I